MGLNDDLAAVKNNVYGEQSVKSPGIKSFVDMRAYVSRQMMREILVFIWKTLGRPCGQADIDCVSLRGDLFCHFYRDNKRLQYWSSDIAYTYYPEVINGRYRSQRRKNKNASQ